MRPIILFMFFFHVPSISHVEGKLTLQEGLRWTYVEGEAQLNWGH